MSDVWIEWRVISKEIWTRDDHRKVWRRTTNVVFSKLVWRVIVRVIEWKWELWVWYSRESSEEWCGERFESWCSRIREKSDIDMRTTTLEINYPITKKKQRTLSWNRSPPSWKYSINEVTMSGEICKNRWNEKRERERERERERVIVRILTVFGFCGETENRESGETWLHDPHESCS